MALKAQLIHSKPIFDSAMSLFNNVMMMPAVSDAEFTLVAKRQFSFFGLRGDFKSMIDVQKKLVGRYPQNVEESNKLAEVLNASGYNLDAIKILERVHKLDSSNHFAMPTLGKIRANNKWKNI